MNNDNIKNSIQRKIIRRIFGLALFFSTLTGFAQMPIFKRYYIADIPGLGWLADFFVTYFMHYISAAVLLGLSAYMITAYALNRSKLQVTVTGYVRAVILFLIFFTGILLVFRNLPGYRFSPQFVISLDFSHLGLMFLYMLAVLAALVIRQKWLKDEPAD
jgi:hypothetical protein